MSKITSIKEIENVSYANGDVITQIKSIINTDYDQWRSQHNIGVNEEANAAKSNSFLDTVTQEDIEAYLSESTNAEVSVTSETSKRAA